MKIKARVDTTGWVGSYGHGEPSGPSVCAIMLTANRPEYARRAVESFRAQTYTNKWLVVWDSGLEPFQMNANDGEILVRETPFDITIGQRRNTANRLAHAADILIHFDDDDYSHPNRIAEQVQLLQSSGADVVGYNEMLFWREPYTHESTSAYAINRNTRITEPGEAWIYTGAPHEPLGTSLCYHRSTWERKPFHATSSGEDLKFVMGLKVATVSGIGGHGCGSSIANFPPLRDADYPRMIARIHPGNTSAAYRPENMMHAAEWRRVPEWDAYCAEMMK